MPHDIAQLVGSRICHDLISPIGAIGNGVELLQLTDGDSSAEVQLISDSVASANARVRFFRIAFGTANDGQMISRSEVLSILGAVALGGRFTYVWQPEGDISRNDLRLIFLLFQCLESALPLGGEITVTQSGDALSLTATGRKVVQDDGLWQHLTGQPDGSAMTAAQVHFALAPMAAAAAKRTLVVNAIDGQITITL